MGSETGPSRVRLTTLYRWATLFSGGLRIKFAIQPKVQAAILYVASSCSWGEGIRHCSNARIAGQSIAIRNRNDRTVKFNQIVVLEVIQAASDCFAGRTKALSDFLVS